MLLKTLSRRNRSQVPARLHLLLPSGADERIAIVLVLSVARSTMGPDSS